MPFGRFDTDFAGLLAQIAAMPDPCKREAPHPCPDCGEPMIQFTGRHSGRVLRRHYRSACKPEGTWEIVPEPISPDYPVTSTPDPQADQPSRA